MPYNTAHVMNAILARAFKEGRADMSPMKAQKLLFYTHGWHLATTGEPAIDKNFEVWPYGPVVGHIYQSLKSFGSGKITRYIAEYEPLSQKEVAFVVNKTCAKLYEALDIAWEKYIGISAVSLSAMTHEPGSPWDTARNRGLTTIPNDLIREYFVGIARQ